MINVLEEQVTKRWDGLPSKLKEAIFSETNNDFLRELGATNNLSEEIIDQIALTVGDVLMGFLSSDDFEQEIRSANQLDSTVARSISQEINKKIFDPLREDIQRNYAPPSVSNSFVHPVDHPMPEPIPHEGKLSHLKYQEVRGSGSRFEVGSSKMEDEAVEDVDPRVKPEDDNVNAAVPFVLHQEESLDLSANAEDSLVDIPKINISDFKSEEKIESKPNPARIEIGVASISQKSETKSQKEDVRLVHYSTYFSSLAEKLNPRIMDPNPFRPRFVPKSQEKIKKNSLSTIVPRSLVRNPTNKTTQIKPLIKSTRIVPVGGVTGPEIAGVEGNTVYL